MQVPWRAIAVGQAALFLLYIFLPPLHSVLPKGYALPSVWHYDSLLAVFANFVFFVTLIVLPLRWAFRLETSAVGLLKDS